MDRLGLYANRNEQHDFVVNAFETLTAQPCNVYIAVAFFTETEVVERLLEKGCRIRLVVRLGFPTSPSALDRIIKTPGIEVRYFTDTSFHPKIYLFGNHTALVGSANLTKKAITVNQEVVVSLGSDDPRMNELAVLFLDYWSQAKVLTEEAIKDYRVILAKYDHLRAEEDRLENEVLNKLGRVVAGNITRDKVKVSKENIFLEEFRKTYQECVSAFNLIRSIYERYGKRKVPPESIPLRLEIDSFISFVRETHATVDAWMSTPMLTGSEQEKVIEKLVAEWHETPWPYFETTIVREKYPRLLNVFGSAAQIEAANDDDLFEALTVVHSFGDRFRFFLGGLPTWKKVFLKANEPKRTRASLSYLLYGPGKVEERMANVIYSPDYKLNEFGQANVQEIVGWCNNEDLPVVNSRTTKVLRYLGFNVVQL